MADAVTDVRGFGEARASQYEGCMVGLALGDALGAPVEFLSLAEIRKEYGPDGICGLERWRDFSPGHFTDDTQMSLATARGCIDAYLELRHGQSWRPARAVYRRYLAWLKSQEIPYMNRAPGATCLWSLRTGRMGTVEAPLNSRKGCGGVMRVAPAGLAFPPALAFVHAVEFAAITHGHPSGYLPAGALAAIIACLLEARTLEAAIDFARSELEAYAGCAETREAIERAVHLAETCVPADEALPRLGEGWVGEEALAISLYCALSHRDDWEAAVLVAVNHSGDSDSTGCITGAILGAMHGVEVLPPSWVGQLESVAGIRAVAHDLFRVVREGMEPLARERGE